MPDERENCGMCPFFKRHGVAVADFSGCCCMDSNPAAAMERHSRELPSDRIREGYLLGAHLVCSDLVVICARWPVSAGSW